MLDTTDKEYIDDTDELYDKKQMEHKRDGSHRYLWKMGAELLAFMLENPNKFADEDNRRQLLNEWVALHAFVLKLDRKQGDQYPYSL